MRINQSLAHLEVQTIKMINKDGFIVFQEGRSLPKGMYQSSSYYKMYKDSIVLNISMPPQAPVQDDNLKKFIEKPKVYRFSSLDKIPESFKGGIRILKEKRF